MDPMLRRAIITIVVLMMGACLLVIAAGYLLEAQERAFLGRQKSQLYSTARALEAYHADHGAYPPMALRLGNGRIAVPTASGQAVIAGDTADFRIPSSPARPLVADAVVRGRTFRAWSKDGDDGERFATLTTPVAYMTGYGFDIYTAQHLPPRYHAGKDGFIVGYFGVDRDEMTGGDLPWAAPFAGFDNPLPPPGSMEAVFDTRIPQPSVVLLTGWAVGPGKGAYTYNPANGTFSEGDIWRIGGKAGTGNSIK